MPHGVALAAVYAKHVRARVHKHGYARFKIERVDACAHKITLVFVKHFVGVFLVLFIVLAEDEIHKVIVAIHNGKTVEFVVPDDVVCL